MTLEITDEQRDVILMALNNEMCPRLLEHGTVMDCDLKTASQLNEVYKKISGEDCAAWLVLLARSSNRT